ncbi:hypothetical protein [Edaphocola aurantiacus]|uniref:hypothetical protein n=1 Tax=Edaphocola aurantiacus TaxID=2601682 RepID=UPI000FA34E9D|nr:hypothetical protein [Edaphocola aurantiacus]
MRKIIGILSLLLIVGIGGYIYWFYINRFSDGQREGVLQKFSRKGNVFKTYEGEILMSGFGRVGGNFQAQYFYFSVEDPKVVATMEQNIGKNVIIHYNQYRKSLPWRGETYTNMNEKRGQYIVDKVEVSNTPVQPLQQQAAEDIIAY